MSDFGALFLLGLVYGATVCSFTCLPYLGPFLLGTGNGFQDGIASSLIFMLGKLVCYAVMGGIAAFLGRIVTHDGTAIIMGTALIAVGVALPFLGGGECSKRCQIVGKRLSLFALGASTSLIPCPPVSAMLLLAAHQRSIGAGVLYGMIYGTGLLVSPLVIAGGGMALIAKHLRIEIRKIMPYLQGLSAVLIVVMGAGILVRANLF
jgi:thiol:disulfide interchange protein DsbD